MKRSSISYLMCYINVGCCIVFALQHDLLWLLISFGFAFYNWCIAEKQRGIENETNENGDSRDGNDDSQTKE